MKWYWGISALLLASQAAYARDVSVVYHEIAQNWRVEAVAGESLAELRFEGMGREFRLELASNTRITAGLRHLGFFKADSDYALYKGRIADNEKSWVRLAHLREGWQGLIWDGEELFAIEPARALAGVATREIGSSGTVIFRVDDMRVAPGTLGCSVRSSGESTGAEKVSYGRLVGELKSTVTQSLDVALLGDALFTSDNASDPIGALAARLNNIDGIYSDQLGITLNLVESRAFDSASDPLTSSTDGNTLLQDLGTYKLTEPALQPLGAVLLYTGRDLDGSTAGTAYREALCSSRFGVAVSEARRTLTTDSLVGAHEIGHIFGAPHDGETGSPCESTPRTFLMSPSISGSSTFSACSLEQMQPEIDSASCLKTVQSVDASITITPTVASVDDGQEFRLAVVVANEGADPAEAVTARIDIPASVSLLDAGSICVASAGGADCDFGAVAAGSEATTTLDLEAREAGTAEFSASVTAAGDINAANDSATAQVTINALVDVAISLTGPATLTEGDEVDFEIALENLSAAPATSLQIDLVIPDIVSATTVSTVTGSCNLVATGASCSLAELGAGETLSVTVGLRAETAGSAALEADASAGETDPDLANNTATLAVEISSEASAPPDPAPPPDPSQVPDSGGGGGGNGLWLLAAGWIGLLVRWHRSEQSPLLLASFFRWILKPGL